MLLCKHMKSGKVSRMCAEAFECCSPGNGEGLAGTAAFSCLLERSLGLISCLPDGF